MKLIVAADANWAIGKGGELLVRIPADMKFFSQKTTGNVIVMGRKTLESFPGGVPLPKRINIVLTTNKNYDGRGALVVHGEEELKKALKEIEKESPEKEIYVAGGESIYRMLLPYCDTAFVTKLEYAYEADTWMPNLDEEAGWSLAEIGEEQTCFDLIYHNKIYKNKNPKLF